MRVIKEINSSDIKITVFSWNNKYLLKYEQGMAEQTFKINEMDVLEENDLEIFFGEEFMQKVQKRFDEMHQTLRNQLENI